MEKTIKEQIQSLELQIDELYQQIDELQIRDRLEKADKRYQAEVAWIKQNPQFIHLLRG